jgi:hypothetical protein
MASRRQIEANRRNSKLSTGPTSEQGRQKVSKNACTHCLTATESFPGHIQQRIDERFELWSDEFPARNDYERWLAKRVVTASVQIDLATERKDTWRADLAYRAEFCWDAERTEAVEALARQLPDQPGWVVARLRTSVHGRLWLGRQWAALAESQRQRSPEGVETLNPLGDEARQRALELLGVDLLFHSSCRRLDPCPDSEQSPAEHQATLIARQIAELETGLDGMAQAEEYARRLAIQGTGPGFDAMDLVINRYENKAERRYDRAEQALREAQSAPAGRAPARPPEVYEVEARVETSTVAAGPAEISEVRTADPAPAETPDTAPDHAEVKAVVAAAVSEEAADPVILPAAPASDEAADRPPPELANPPAQHRADAPHNVLGAAGWNQRPRNRRERRALAARARRH